MISPPAAKMRLRAASVTEGAQTELGDLEDAEVVGDGSDDDGGFASTASAGHLADKTRDRHRGVVDARHKETLQHNLVEGGVSSSGQEAVGLDEEGQVDILRNWS